MSVCKHRQLRPALRAEEAAGPVKQALPRAIISLDAKWVIASNLFQETVPRPVAEALGDRSRFIPVATFREGAYFMSAYRVIR